MAPFVPKSDDNKVSYIFILSQWILSVICASKN